MSKSLGTILQVALIITLVVFQQYWAAAALAVSLAGSMLLRPDAPRLPRPEDGRLLDRQALPPRFHGIGRSSRRAGALMLRESAGGKLYTILAFHDGLIDGFEHIYLSDEEITIGTDGQGNTHAVIEPAHYMRDGSSHVHIVKRLGAVPETAITTIATTVPHWTTDHRGDGIAKIAMECWSASADKHAAVFAASNGQAPEITAVARLSKIYDPRDDAQDQNDPSTWVWSANAALGVAYAITSERCLRFNWSKRIAPAIDEWIAAANICDEEVPLRDGGVTPRYECHLGWEETNRPVDVIQMALGAMDGWLYLRPDGALGIRAGKYEAPAVRIDGRHIRNIQVFQGRKVEDRVNEVQASYISPAHKWIEQQAPSWRDEADISQRGQTKSAKLGLIQVQGFSQCRRLQKRAMARHKAPLRGTCTTDAYGLMAKSERYLTLDLSAIGRGDLDVEVTGYRQTLWPLGATIEWVLADPTIDEWDPETEEGDPPPVPDTTPYDESLVIDPPTITEVTPQVYNAGAGDIGVRLIVEISDPGIEGRLLEVQYTPQYEWKWRIEAVSPSATDGATYLHATAPVTANIYYSVQARWRVTGGIYSDWSASTNVLTDFALAAPGSPTITAYDGWAGAYSVNARQPGDGYARTARVWVAPFGTPFGSATDVSGAIFAGPSVSIEFNAMISPGSYSIWVTAENSTGNASPPAGPVTVTVT